MLTRVEPYIGRELTSRHRGAPVGAVPILSHSAMNEREQGLLARLKLTVGMPDEAYTKLIESLVRRIADVTQLVPATANRYHFQQGGLWRHSLEVAVFALQLAESRVVSGKLPSEKRYAAEERFRLAAVYAGLVHDLGKLVTDVDVVGDNGSTWSPYTASIVEWARAQHVSNYVVCWKNADAAPKPYRPFSGVLAQRLLPPEGLAYIGEAGNALVHELLLCVSGIEMPQSQNTLLSVVQAAKSASMEKDHRSRGGLGPSGTVGMPIERYIVDALRRLAREEWKPNDAGGCVWVTRTGVFLDWNRVASQVVALLRADGVTWVPRDAVSLAEILISHKLATPAYKDGIQRLLWTIRPTKDRAVEALQIAHAELVYPHAMPQQIDVDVEFAETHIETSLPPSPKVSSGSRAEGVSIDCGEVETAPQDLIEEEPLPVSAQQSLSLDEATQEEHAANGAAEEVDAAECKIRLQKLGSMGVVLMYLAEDVRKGQKRIGVDLIEAKDQLAVAFPDAVQGYGVEVSKLLSDAVANEMVRPSPENPKSAVVELKNSAGLATRAVVLTDEISLLVRQLAGVDHRGKTKTTASTATPIALSHFFGELLAGAMRAELPFDLMATEHGVAAAYPAVCEWYARVLTNRPLTDVTRALTRREILVATGARASDKTTFGKEVLVFRRDLCRDLHQALVSLKASQKGAST